MRFYILLLFWLQLLAAIIRLVEMAAVEWPQERKPKSLGQHLTETVIGIVFTMWAAWLLWSR